MTESDRPDKRGIVYIVGAGPGDPGLLTLRARYVLDNCEAIVYDAEIDASVLRSTTRNTVEEPELRAVGTLPGGVRDRVGPRLVKLARMGKRVVRLTKGDPMLFAHGGEEAQSLNDADIEFEIVPGVPADSAVPAYAGIPVTYPGLSSAVTFASRYGESADMGARTNWEALSKAGGTIVVNASADVLAEHLSALVAGGMPGDVPAAAIAFGTTPRQRTIVATLETLAERVAAAQLGDASVIAVMGWTVVMRDELSWFERRPLFGKRIVITRPEPNTPLSIRLRELGADVIEMPATRIELLDLAPLYGALLALGDYQWVVFTSQQTVKIVWQTLRAAQRDARAFAGTQIVAVGPGTADALLQHGLAVDVIPERYSAEGVLEALRDRIDLTGAQVLYPVAEGARDVLAQGLRELGAEVEELPVYRSLSVGEEVDELKDALRAGSIDYVTYTAGSTVRGFVQAVGPELAARARAATIGPITSAAARELGLSVSIEANPATVEGLVQAILTAE
jgi:uroporphyrinogen III methyltransferase / synthase